MPTPDDDWAKFSCVDCGINTSLSMGNGEYYVVEDDLWQMANMEPNGGMLCIGCIETRLGRELTGQDFKNCLANLDPGVSERLLDRRTRELPDDLRAIRIALKAFDTLDANLPFILAGVEQYLATRHGVLQDSRS